MTTTTTPIEVDPAKEIPAKDFAAIQKVFPDGPTGKFIKGRYGVTHYMLEPPSGGDSPTQKVVVMAHGLGTNLHVYDELSEALTKQGYTVVRYDYFNHGFSKADEKNLKINDTVMLAQVEDLLNFLKISDVYAFVGHSTGGVVGVLAAQKLTKFNITRLALVSPALWAKKSTVAKLSNKLPGMIHFMLGTNLRLAKNAVKDNYIVNTHIAFAKNDNGEYNYPEVYKKALADNEVLFDNHPYIAYGVGNVDGYFLNESLLGGWRDAMKDVATRTDTPVETRLIFGTKDVVVDFESPYLTELGELERVQVVPIEGQGHESLYENTPPIAEAMIKFFDE